MPMLMEKDLQDNDTCGGTEHVLSTDFECQPCNLLSNTTVQNGYGLSPNFHPHNPHSLNCSYGIQALINNVQRGYINDDEDGDPDDSTLMELSQQHESEILRRWRRKKELELQARQMESQAMHDSILEQASIERENFYKEREAHIEAKKRSNRQSETKYHNDVKSQKKLVEGNLWEVVADLIDLKGEVDGKTANGPGKLPKSPKLTTELSTPKKLESKKRRDPPKITKKTTDLSRMREILLKLQHQPLVR